MALKQGPKNTTDFGELDILDIVDAKSELVNCFCRCAIIVRMSSEKRPPSDRGQGRKPLSPSGEAMKTRAMRWSDSDWNDALYIGVERVRELTRKEAARLRRQARARSED